jgi:hypothetical protein
MLTLAVGVLEALIMYASWISCLAAPVVLKCLDTWATRWLEALEACREDMAMRTDMMRDVRSILLGNIYILKDEG